MTSFDALWRYMDICCYLQLKVWFDIYTNEDTNLFLFDMATMPTLRLNNGKADCSDTVIDPGFTSESQNDSILQTP